MIIGVTDPEKLIGEGLACKDKAVGRPGGAAFCRRPDAVEREGNLKSRELRIGVDILLPVSQRREVLTGDPVLRTGGRGNIGPVGGEAHGDAGFL